MRILIVSQYFRPESFRVNDLASGLVERGHEVVVLTGQPNYEKGSFYEGYSAFSPRKEVIDGVIVYRFPLVSRGRKTGARLALNYVSFAVSASLLAPFRIRDKFDVLIVFQMSPITMALPALVVGRLRRLPIVFWVQDLWPDTLRAMGKVRSERALRWLRMLVGRTYQACELVLVVSRGFISQIEATGFPKERVAYCPNWAEPVYQPVDVPADAPERKELPEGFRVMFAGNIGLGQSVDTIIDAADRLRTLPNLRWVFIGDGRRREWAENRVAALGLANRVTFVGRRRVEDMPVYLALADVLVVSLTRDDVFACSLPSKLASYLACARPVVASLDGEGARVVAEAGAGLACPAEDAGALADAIMTMYNLPEDRRRELGEAGRAYCARHFDRDVVLRQIEGWLSGARASRVGP